MFVDLCLSEQADKRLEAIKQINARFRGETVLPNMKPVN